MLDKVSYTICVLFSDDQGSAEIHRMLTGCSTCTVIFCPALMYVLAVGYPIWTFCANAAETASEARVRNDANFIGSN